MPLVGSQHLTEAPRSRVLAGVLAIFLGIFGVHNFYLRRHGIAVGQLLMTALTLGLFSPLVLIWSWVEAVMILTRARYFRADGHGVPLRDGPV